MKDQQLDSMLQALSANSDLFYQIESISLADGGSCWYGVMSYSEKIYEVYTAQVHHQGLTCLGDKGDPFPSIVYKAQYTVLTDDTLHVYTRKGYHGHRHGCTLLEAAIKHCIEKKWTVSVSTDISQIKTVFLGAGLKEDGIGYWRWDQAIDALAVLGKSQGNLGGD